MASFQDELDQEQQEHILREASEEELKTYSRHYRELVEKYDEANSRTARVTDELLGLSKDYREAQNEISRLRKALDSADMDSRVAPSLRRLTAGPASTSSSRAQSLTPSRLRSTSIATSSTAGIKRSAKVAGLEDVEEEEEQEEEEEVRSLVAVSREAPIRPVDRPTKLDEAVMWTRQDATEEHGARFRLSNGKRKLVPVSTWKQANGEPVAPGQAKSTKQLLTRSAKTLLDLLPIEDRHNREATWTNISSLHPQAAQEELNRIETVAPFLALCDPTQWKATIAVSEKISEVKKPQRRRKQPRSEKGKGKARESSTEALDRTSQIPSDQEQLPSDDDDESPSKRNGDSSTHLDTSRPSSSTTQKAAQGSSKPQVPAKSSIPPLMPKKTSKSASVQGSNMARYTAPAPGSEAAQKAAAAAKAQAKAQDEGAPTPPTKKAMAPKKARKVPELLTSKSRPNAKKLEELLDAIPDFPYESRFRSIIDTLKQGVQVPPGKKTVSRIRLFVANLLDTRQPVKLTESGAVDLTPESDESDNDDEEATPLSFGHKIVSGEGWKDGIAPKPMWFELIGSWDNLGTLPMLHSMLAGWLQVCRIARERLPADFSANDFALLLFENRSPSFLEGIGQLLEIEGLGLPGGAPEIEGNA